MIGKLVLLCVFFWELFSDQLYICIYRDTSEHVANVKVHMCDICVSMHIYVRIWLFIYIYIYLCASI